MLAPLKNEVYGSLFIKGKRVLVNTRYKEEFETILRENRIEQINI